MTTVIVNAGICGFSTTISAEREPDKKVRITLETECEMVRKMAGDVELLDIMSAFTGFKNNAVYGVAARHLRHVACPVPSGILKALEAECGFALPRDASITFVKKGR